MENIFIIIGSIAVAVLAIFIVGYLKYKKINIPSLFTKVESALSTVKNIEAIIKDNTTGKLQIATANAQLITDEALKLVVGAEKKYLAGDIKAEDRKPTVITDLTNFLISNKITIDDNLAKYIDLIVSYAVKKSGMDDTNKQIDAKIAAITKTNNELQQQVSKLSIENSTLQQKLTTVQNTVAPTQNTNTPAPVQK
ncbi:hypothetical protein AB8U03_15780 [Clostridium sp. Mt-5]|uniref:Uncharacterized protein n=1 Tax=Clostridium moutaii TaxID=3240932 RepID=A0ABV4BT00_9CLOT